MQKHPNKKIVKKPRLAQRIQKKSILTVADNLSEKSPFSTMNIHQTFKSYPQLQNINKKNTDVDSLLNIAQRTIDRYLETWIHIYTDGSAFKGNMNAGYGARVQFPDQTREELFKSCGAHSSNYEAEVRAIEASLKYLHEECETEKQHRHLLRWK